MTGAPSGGSGLLRNFTLASLVAFVLVGAALLVLERGEMSTFADIQRRQTA